MSWGDEAAAREAGKDKSTQTGWEVDPPEGRHQLGPVSVREPKTEQVPSVPVVPVQAQDMMASKPETDSGAAKAKSKAQARKSSVDDGSSGRGRNQARRNSGEHP